MARLAAFFAMIFLGAVTFLGIRDFSRQAEYSGLTMAEFGFAGWRESFAYRGANAGKQRLATIKTDPSLVSKAVQSVAPALVQTQAALPVGISKRSYLPRADAHWHTADWTAAHDYLFAGITEGLTEDQLRGVGPTWAMSQSQQFERLNRLWPSVIEPDLMTYRQVYQRHGWSIGVSIDASNRPQPRVLAAIGGGSRGGLVQSVFSGVAFRDITELSTATDGTRVLQGRLGNGIVITVYSNASDRAIKRVLSGIDYAGLNRLQNNPVGGIFTGSARHARLVAQMGRDAPRLRRAMASRERAASAKLDSRVRDVKFAGRFASRVCQDLNGKRICKDIEA